MYLIFYSQSIFEFDHLVCCKTRNKSKWIDKFNQFHYIGIKQDVHSSELIGQIDRRIQSGRKIGTQFADLKVEEFVIDRWPR